MNIITTTAGTHGFSHQCCTGGGVRIDELKVSGPPAIGRPKESGFNRDVSGRIDITSGEIFGKAEGVMLGKRGIAGVPNLKGREYMVDSEIM
jgi:hypothetical protein